MHLHLTNFQIDLTSSKIGPQYYKVMAGHILLTPTEVCLRDVGGNLGLEVRLFAWAGKPSPFSKNSVRDFREGISESCIRRLFIYISY